MCEDLFRLWGKGGEGGGEASGEDPQIKVTSQDLVGQEFEAKYFGNKPPGLASYCTCGPGWERV